MIYSSSKINYATTLDNHNIVKTTSYIVHELNEF